MALEIKVLDLGDIKLESSFLVHARDCGKTARVPTFGYLIVGGEAPILVDTGYRSPEVMAAMGMRGIQTREQQLENQLALHGMKYKDVKYILHTHMHIDHGGLDDKFPMSTIVGLNRKELESGVNGLMGGQYPAADIKHLIDRLHTKQALRLFDTEITGGEEVIPGVVCVFAGAHTAGSMNIMVDTAVGTAIMCGDVVYDVQDQLVAPMHVENGYMNLVAEPTITGNHSESTRNEVGAMKKLLNNATFICPSHDRPAVVKNARVVGRLHDTVPGPVSQINTKRNWFRV